jgi:hypothetical protein
MNQQPDNTGIAKFKPQRTVLDMGDLRQRHRVVGSFCKTYIGPAFKQSAVSRQWRILNDIVFVPYVKEAIRFYEDSFISSFFLVRMKPHIGISRAVWPDRNFIKLNYRREQVGRNTSQEVPPTKWNEETLTIQIQVSGKKNKRKRERTPFAA